ncbi:MAG: DUF5916 domain-containing protein [Vicinamibacterales bacterium]
MTRGRPRRRRAAVVVVAWLAGAAADTTAHAAQAQGGDGALKRATASRVAAGDITVDGRLTESVWRTATPLADLVQKEPTQGAPPTDGMEVRFAYDDRAFYVGARMFAKSAAAIQAPLGRRDVVDQAERILIGLDTFHDRRTAVVLGVTAAGVRLDRFHAADAEDSFDATYDLVWDAAATVDDTGWSAELWIPFAQLRFNPEQDLTWGLNVQRFRPSLNEEDTWVLIPRTVRAWASRFGELQGVSSVPRARRVELLPYVAGASTIYPSSPGDPFRQGLNPAARVGADVKMGLGPNLTLEATINPDFGQVEADPAEVNLTAFETRFPERRPFFLEGAPLFNIGHPNFYYSRRIGARPVGPATGDFVNYPANTTILGAAKLTGRLPSRTSVAFLSAVTAEESAEVATAGDPAAREVTVAPHTFYGIGRVLQEFGRQGSTAGVLASAVHRDFGDGDPLADLQARDALALAGSTVLRFNGGQYEFRTSGGGSLVSGTAAAIERVQRSSSHFAQRPDRTYSPLDPTRTSLGGWSLQVAFDRLSGRHWLWGANSKLDSENFETNDLAILNGADGWLSNANIQFRETTPGRVLRAYAIRTDAQADTTLRRLVQAGFVRATLNLTWANFWTTSIAVRRDLPQTNVALTRGGPLMGRGPGATAVISLGNRAGSQTRWTATSTLSRNDDGLRLRRVSTLVSVRPGPRWQLSAEPFYETLTEPQQYVSTLAGGRPETYGSRYVFAFIDRSTVSTEFRLGLTVKPDMNLDVYAEPFAASGRYYDYGELLAARSRDRLRYGTSGTTLTVNADGSRTIAADGTAFTLRNRDFNTLSFRSNVVLRWEWRPGSTLYVVWQQDRSGTQTRSDAIGLGDMFRSARATGTNFFVVKTTFWLPVR